MKESLQGVCCPLHGLQALSKTVSLIKNPKLKHSFLHLSFRSVPEISDKDWSLMDLWNPQWSGKYLGISTYHMHFIFQRTIIGSYWVCCRIRFCFSNNCPWFIPKNNPPFWQATMKFWCVGLHTWTSSLVTKCLLVEGGWSGQYSTYKQNAFQKKVSRCSWFQGFRTIPTNFVDLNRVQQLETTRSNKNDTCQEKSTFLGGHRFPLKTPLPRHALGSNRMKASGWTYALQTKQYCWSALLTVFA